MNVSLTSELEDFINSKVQSGLYNSASEVIRQGLRLLVMQETEQKVRLEALRCAIQDGIDSGEPIPWTLESFLSQAKAQKSKEQG